MPVEKNKEYIVDIIDNGFEGEGIAKIDGFTIFIPNAIKGEKIKGGNRMQHKVKVTVLDKKLYPELQQEYCAVPDSGKCPCYYVGDEFIFCRNDEKDDFWHCGEGTLVKSGQPDEGCLQSPGTAHCGTKGVPFCAEAWDAVARYIYTGLQGGSIMRGWMKEENTMIACCNDGTRPVIFKIERIDCE